METLKQWIVDALFDNGKPNCNKVKETYVQKYLQYQEIMDKTSFLTDPKNFSERIYCIMNDIADAAKCKTCGKELKFKAYGPGYSTYCSSKCAQKDEDVRQKIEDTCKEKYGSNSPAGNAEVMKKMQDTCKEKYGVKNVFESNEFQQRATETIRELYGVDNVAVLEEIKEKKKQTCMETIGYETPFHSPEIQQKIKETFVEKYGFDNPQKNEQIAQKTKDTWNNKSKEEMDKIKENQKETWLKTCGETNPFKTEEFKQKLIQDCLEKHGVRHFSQINISKESLELSNNKEFLIEQHHNLKKPICQIAKDLGVSECNIGQKMKRFGIEVKIYGFSQAEKEIQDFIGENITTNSRSIIPPYELDIYLPNHNLAIEYDGLFWHSCDESDQGKMENYHLNKTKKCKEKQIRLFHIFENEWKDEIKNDIWKSMIESKMGKNKIILEKYEISIIDDKQGFYSENHLKGDSKSDINIALIHENQIVAMMSFFKSNQKYEWLMTRYCCKKHNNVIGAANKMFQFFIENYHPKSIFTFVDLRYSQGKSFSKMGMRHVTNLTPNYYYVYGDKLFYKSDTGKYELLEILNNVDETKTEEENMFANGFRKIWDCGNIVMDWRAS